VHSECLDVREGLCDSFLTIVSVGLSRIGVFAQDVRALSLGMVFLAEVPDWVFHVRPEVPHEVTLPVLFFSFFNGITFFLVFLEMHVLTCALNFEMSVAFHSDISRLHTLECFELKIVVQVSEH